MASTTYLNWRRSSFLEFAALQHKRFAVFWAVCLGISGSLAIFFYRKRWIGRR